MNVSGTKVGETMNCIKCKRQMKLKNERTMIDVRTDETYREHKFSCVHCGITEVFEK